MNDVRPTPFSPQFQAFLNILEEEAISGGVYRPEVCARCDLNGSHLCTRRGCDMTAQDAIVYLNGGRMPSPPKREI